MSVTPEEEGKNDSEVRIAFGKLLIAGFEEAVSAILEELGKGRRATRRAGIPDYSVRENGMPWLTDGRWSARGPIEYSSLLDPLYGDEEAKALGMFPAARFPAIDELRRVASANPRAVRLYGQAANSADLLNNIAVDLMIAAAADHYFQFYGEVPLTPEARRSVLSPLLRSLFDETLAVAVIAPIALVRFDFDRLRLGPSSFLMRMSPALQQARWQMKSYGATGHDQVVAAATHCFVITGFTVQNNNWLALTQSMGGFSPEIREQIDQLFGALRIVTGVESGYAQEVRLARGWLRKHNHGLPEVFTVGARRYPETFDDFGWDRAPLPLIARPEMLKVVDMLGMVEKIDEDRYVLAVRRLNSGMNRSDAADAILDATIALEILLSDGDSQAVSWKLRMRAGALAALGGGVACAASMSETIKSVYAARSAIVHGGHRRRRPKDAPDDREQARTQALEVLRTILDVLAKNPRYLDPARIDVELLMSPPVMSPGV